MSVSAMSDGRLAALRSHTNLRGAMLPLDLAESSNSKPATVRGSVQNIFRWVVGVVAVFKRPSKYISRPERSASDKTVESLADSAAEAAVVPTATNSAVAKIGPNGGFAGPVTAEDKISEDARINPVAPILLDQQEIQRRRDLVRSLFNDFWSGSYDKPAAFVDRLDQAETYLNERLTASGELWLLDAQTRALLGLPPRGRATPA
jgi:hypothetical protein